MMAKHFRKQWADQDGDVLTVSGWPVIPGVVFSTRFKDESVGPVVELTKDQVKDLIKFLGDTLR